MMTIYQGVLTVASGIYSNSSSAEICGASPSAVYLEAMVPPVAIRSIFFMLSPCVIVIHMFNLLYLHFLKPYFVAKSFFHKYFTLYRQRARPNHPRQALLSFSPLYIISILSENILQYIRYNKFRSLSHF